MKKFFPFILLLSACQAAGPPDTCPLTQMDTRRQEEMCRHYAGEEPYDAARKAFLKREMEKLNCGLFF